MSQAGFYETDITPSIGMERPATYYKLFHEAIHDSLKVRACVLDDGNDRIAIVGVDTAALGKRTVQKAKFAIRDKCNIKEDNVLLAATHTHSGGPLLGFCEEDLCGTPEFIKRLALDESVCLNIDYEKHVIGQIMTAVHMADRNKCETRLSVGSGYEDKVVFNRRFKLKSGKSATHPGKGNPEILKPAGPIDPEVGVIALWDNSDKLLGCIVNYACHATCHGADVSADWIYYLEQAVRGTMGKQANVIFLNGACGDVTQVDNQSLRPVELGKKWSRYVGTRVGAETLKVLVSAEKSEQFKLAALTEKISLKMRRPSAENLARCRKICEDMIVLPQKTTEFYFAKEKLVLDDVVSRAEDKTILIQAIQIGPAVFLANPSEYFCQFGLDIKKKSNFPFTFVVELANGCCGYVPTEDAFSVEHGGGYETVLTSYSNLEVNAGRKIQESCLRLAGILVPDKVPMGEQIKPSRKIWGFGALGPELE